MYDIFTSFNEPVEAFQHEYCERFSPKTLRAAPKKALVMEASSS